MRATPLKLMRVAGLVATAACSNKKKDLPPPPPPPSAPAAETPMPSAPMGSVTSSAVPGSLQEFIDQAGSDRVFFAYDSYEVDDTAKETLTRQVRWLQKYPRQRITIEGHADERGTREYNLALGDRRATAVKNFLASQGVATARMSTISYGKERPAVQGSDDEAYAKNRRGVIVLGNSAG